MADNPPPPRHPGLRVLALLKLLKAALLLVVGFGSLRMVNGDLSETARNWAHRLTIDPENHLLLFIHRHAKLGNFLHHLLTNASNLEPKQVRAFSKWALFFAADQIIEGIGLWYNLTWAKYLLVVVTPCFLCIELTHMVVDLVHHRFSYVRAVSIGIAVLIMVYVGWILLMDRRYRKAHA